MCYKFCMMKFSKYIVPRRATHYFSDQIKTIFYMSAILSTLHNCYHKLLKNSRQQNGSWLWFGFKYTYKNENLSYQWRAKSVNVSYYTMDEQRGFLYVRKLGKLNGTSDTLLIAQARLNLATNIFQSNALNCMVEFSI